jgi:hypothetical protein
MASFGIALIVYFAMKHSFDKSGRIAYYINFVKNAMQHRGSPLQIKARGDGTPGTNWHHTSADQLSEKLAAPSTIGSAGQPLGNSQRQSGSANVQIAGSQPYVGGPNQPEKTQKQREQEREDAKRAEQERAKFNRDLKEVIEQMESALEGFKKICDDKPCFFNIECIELTGIIKNIGSGIQACCRDGNVLVDLRRFASLNSKIEQKALLERSIKKISPAAAKLVEVLAIRTWCIGFKRHFRDMMLRFCEQLLNSCDDDGTIRSNIEKLAEMIDVTSYFGSITPYHYVGSLVLTYSQARMFIDSAELFYAAGPTAAENTGAFNSLCETFAAFRNGLMRKYSKEEMAEARRSTGTEMAPDSVQCDGAYANVAKMGNCVEIYKILGLYQSVRMCVQCELTKLEENRIWKFKTSPQFLSEGDLQAFVKKLGEDGNGEKAKHTARLIRAHMALDKISHAIGHSDKPVQCSFDKLSGAVSTILGPETGDDDANNAIAVMEEQLGKARDSQLD